MDGIIDIMRSNDGTMISLSYNRSNNGIMIIYIMIYYNAKDNDNIICLLMRVIKLGMMILQAMIIHDLHVQSA